MQTVNELLRGTVGSTWLVNEDKSGKRTLKEALIGNKVAMDIHQITQLLPHRFPFLFVDRILEYEAYKKLVGYKNVTANEEYFNGHFPGHPVMPGVLILEALAQACALLAYLSTGHAAKDYVVYLMGIDGARFRKPVVPGDQLTLTAEVIKNKPSVWKQRGVAEVAGQVVAEAEFMASIVKRQPSTP